MQWVTRRHRVWLRHLTELCSSSNKHGSILQQITIGLCCGLLSLLLLLSYIGLLVVCLTAKTDATSQFYDTCELTTEGYLHYVTSASGYSPNDRLDDGALHMLYFASSAERALGYNDQYITNLTDTECIGWIGDGYQIRISTGGNLEVYQDYTYNNNSRSTWFEYRFEPTDINTNMLYRPDRNNTYITAINIFFICATAWCLVKAVRHD